MRDTMTGSGPAASEGWSALLANEPVFGTSGTVFVQPPRRLGGILGVTHSGTHRTSRRAHRPLVGESRT